MRIEEAYAILGVGRDAGLEDIKKAYRQQAFATHPDLRPGDAEAKLRFQRLSEAYVLLKKRLEQEPAKAKKTSASDREKPRSASARQKASARASTKAKQDGYTAYKNASKEEYDGAHFTFRPEDVLNDLLKDPFARQVFEDIYDKAQTGTTGRAPKKPASPTKKPTPDSKKVLDWSDSKAVVNTAKKAWKGVQGFFRGQLDDKQEVRLPISLLAPGRRIRVSVAFGLSGKPVTVDVTLPKDFTLGKPVRLKGMGKRIGPWRGDLYLLLLPNNDESGREARKG